MMEIRPSKREEIPAINRLIAASKSYWDYDPRYLEAAIPLVQIDEEWLSQNMAYSLCEGDLVGFLGIERAEDHWHLEHLWIKPDHIKGGYGRQAIGFLKRLAEEHSIRKITVFPDPPAEGFYEKLGAIHTGIVVPSRIPSGPEFHQMIFSSNP